MRTLYLLLPLLLILACSDRHKVTGSHDNGNNNPPPSGPHAPNPPQNLHADILVGMSLTLRWTDASENETRFDVSHGLDSASTLVDSVAANTTEFAETVGRTIGLYHFKVRAVNDVGASGWVSLDVNYRFCSAGVIPLCVGNYWNYQVTDSAGTSQVHRTIADMQLFGSDDYYLFTDSLTSSDSATSGRVDSVFYLHNAGRTVQCMDVPPGPHDTLFCASALSGVNYYYFKADCVLVLNPLPGSPYTVGGRTYHNVMGYQRFLSDEPGHSFQYFVATDSVGVIREDEYVGSGDRISRRDLTAYQVLN